MGSSNLQAMPGKETLLKGEYKCCQEIKKHQLLESADQAIGCTGRNYRMEMSPLSVQTATKDSIVKRLLTPVATHINIPAPANPVDLKPTYNKGELKMKYTSYLGTPYQKVVNIPNKISFGKAKYELSEIFSNYGSHRGHKEALALAKLYRLNGVPSRAIAYSGFTVVYTRS
jgi:hypothetical protein